MKFDDAPRLSKLPFVLGNIVLLALAWFIYAHHPNPFSPLPLFIIFVCFVVGILASMYPFVVNHVRDQAYAATSLRHELDEQFKRLVAASEHLQNSILQLKSIEGIVTTNMEAAKGLPSVLQERIDGFKQQLAAAENKDKARLEQELARLRAGESERQAAIATQITTALGEWTTIEAEARRGFTELVQQEKESFEQQMAALRSADSERQAAAANQITTALAEWTRIEAEARQNLAVVVQQEKELFEQQSVTLRSTDRERQTAAAAQIANALAEWARIEADARLGLASTVQRQKELFEQQVTALRSSENDRVAAAAEEITMTLASWTGIEAGVRRQLGAAAELQEKLAGVLSALDGRIAALQAAVQSAEKITESIPATPPPPPVVLPPPAPAEDVPVMAASAAVEPTAVTASSIAPEPVSAAEVLPDAMIQAASDSPVANEPASTSAPEIEPSPASSQPPVALEGTESIAAAEMPVPAPGSADAHTTIPSDVVAGAEEPKPVSATEAAPQPEPPLAVEPPSEASDATPSLELSDADSPAASLEEPEPLTSSPDTSDAAAPSKPRKPRAPRKPKSESTTPDGAAAETTDEPPPAEESPAELISEPVVDEPSPPEDFSQVPPEETSKPVANQSADGRTRLTVVSYIGIGNKLHLRGEGAGLSWSKGVPLQFVSIGRWRWETDKATGPVTCRIYKNDKLEAPTGPLTLLPGTEQEISAQF